MTKKLNVKICFRFVSDVVCLLPKLFFKCSPTLKKMCFMFLKILKTKNEYGAPIIIKDLVRRYLLKVAVL